MADAITKVAAPDEQHMLFLGLPIVFQPNTDPSTAVMALLGGGGDGVAGPDPRPATGVHFFMTYVLLAGMPQPAPPPFPMFQLPPVNPETKEPRHLLVVMSIYDADFGPYIGAFTADQGFAGELDKLLKIIDETGFIDPSDPTSAKGIIANGGTFQNPDAFVQLLMRYNWSDPTLPGSILGSTVNPPPNPKFFLGATFPGLTIAKLLNTTTGYPGASQLWPSPPVGITYAPSTKP